ncbi:DUF1194 domain-containing protein [Mesorhizobium sp. M0166]|uniref:DUF1194 domain-containing protein n=1 Tax=unclassified Mesorhizobium TaxID=325217 RepID=UPI003338D2CF
MHVLSFSALVAGLLKIVLVSVQYTHANPYTNGLSPDENREKVVFDDPINEVDVAIVLAADMSGSINHIEAKLQRESYAAALESATVLNVIKEGVHGKIAVTFVEWSSRGSLETRVGWTILSDANDAAVIAEALRKKSERRRSGPRGSNTSISYAIDASVDAFDKLPVPTLRRIIDISGDGSNNDGTSVEDSRQRALQKAIVINGLPIGADVENGETTTEYYSRHVIGGPGSFVIPADSAAAFQSAIIRKLIREVSSASGKARS